MTEYSSLTHQTKSNLVLFEQLADMVLRTTSRILAATRDLFSDFVEDVSGAGRRGQTVK